MNYFSSSNIEDCSFNEVSLPLFRDVDINFVNGIFLNGLLFLLDNDTCDDGGRGANILKILVR